MSLVAGVLTVLAQNTQEAPDDGLGIGLILGAIAFVVLVAVAIFVVFTRTTRASRGGVEPPPGERRPGNPPFEGIERGG
jgi:heme/copper-type cytochrome/quinol oxidase subunit 2